MVFACASCGGGFAADGVIEVEPVAGYAGDPIDVCHECAARPESMAVAVAAGRSRVWRNMAPVTGDFFGDVSSIEARAIAAGYADARPVVSAFVFYGRIDTSGDELLDGLFAGCEDAGRPGVCGDADELVAYVRGRCAAGAYGPVVGWLPHR